MDLWVFGTINNSMYVGVNEDMYIAPLAEAFRSDEDWGQRQWGYNERLAVVEASAL